MKTKSLMLLVVLLFSIVPLSSASANSSSDVMLARPNELSCLSDQVLECTLPIDAALSHSWSFKAYNANIAEEYTFRMSVVNSSTNAQVHSASNTVTMAAYDVVDVTFTPWNGWTDGGTYNISFSAVRTNDNSNVGNVRYFLATFKDTVDVAILSDSPTSEIKSDLSILGKSYTQFAMDDWPTYLKSGWMSNFQKIVIPSQNDYSAASTVEGGEGYFENLGDSTNKSVLESFMSTGGTVQLHLTSSTEHYGYSPTTEESHLPFNMNIEARNTAQTAIVYNDVHVANPYHPIFEGVDFGEFQGFDEYGTVAEAVLDTTSTLTSSVPGVCSGYSDHGGYFQRLMQTLADDQDILLGTCNHGAGGMIVTTIDVERESERADSVSFPLLGNLLSHHLDAYPNGFGGAASGTDITLNGNAPPLDPTTGKYTTMYLKSDEEVVFNYATDTVETLDTDWEIEGPTDWQGNPMSGGVDHTNASAPSLAFCKVDLSSETGCLQGATWEITLYLHDEDGNARVLPVTVETNDAFADNFRPVADAELDMRWEYAEQIELIGQKTVSGDDWPVYRVQLDGSGALLVFFDAGNSSDPDASTGNGIQTYEWKVLFDVPYGDFDLEGHTFTMSSASNGQWAYQFSNVTVDSTWTSESQIRIELIVYDGAGKFSEKHRMYFVVVPEGYGDVEPTVLFDLGMNGTEINSDTITLSGTVLDGAEQDEVYVEVGLYDTVFNESAISKYNLAVEEKWDKSENLGNGDAFQLNLNIEDLFDNTTKMQRVFIQHYEGTYPNLRWITFSWIDVVLPACKGVEVPVDVLEAEPAAYWIWNANTSACEWSGRSVDSDGDGIPDSPPDTDGDGIPDNDDVFPFDANESKDSDLDGVGDNGDAFPEDANETVDSDGDGVGDNGDAFPNDANETADSDLDGVGDNGDAFPEDANETVDSDNDGVGDNGDAFPNDANETADSDLDGVGDNGDAFPEDANETVDSDSDGVGDNGDAFPNDANESEDTDGDGVGNNADAFPNDPSETKDSDGDGVGDNYQRQMEQTRNRNIGIGTVLAIVVLIAGTVYRRKGKPGPEEQPKQFDLGNLSASPQEQQQPTVVQQWTEESGYTWRRMSNGDTMWWDGTEWKTYSLEDNEV